MEGEIVIAGFGYCDVGYVEAVIRLGEIDFLKDGHSIHFAGVPVHDGDAFREIPGGGFDVKADMVRPRFQAERPAYQVVVGSYVGKIHAYVSPFGVAISIHSVVETPGNAVVVGIQDSPVFFQC